MNNAPDFSGEKAQSTVNPFELIRPMVAKLRLLTLAVARAEEELTLAQKYLMEYQTREIPEAMQLAGLTELTMDGGVTLKIKADVKASISAANQREAHEWLRKHGHGGVIKTALEVDTRSLTAADRELLQSTAGILGAEAIEKESIHHSTLKALCKELLENGVSLPPSISIYEFKRAELKVPKEST